MNSTKAEISEGCPVVPEQLVALLGEEVALRIQSASWLPNGELRVTLCDGTLVTADSPRSLRRMLDLVRQPAVSQ
jgi:hypothetical protein